MSRQVNKEGRPVVYYVHPREIDPSQPRLPMSLARRFKSYVNLSSTKPKLEKLMSERPLTNFKDWIARDRAAGQKWEIRPFTPKDEGGILSLHQSVFGSPLGAAQWRWQFLDNPFSRPIVWVAQGAQGEIVGHYSLVPVPFQSTEGKETAAYSILSMIHPDYQRKGMLKALAKAAEGQLSDDSIGTVATFLNDNSFPLYTFQLGWKEVSSRLPIYFKIINPGRLIQKYLKNETLSRRLGTILRPVIDLVFPQGEEGGGVAVSRERGFDGRVDALWEKASQGTRFGIRRDAPYLNWRIARSPHPYQLFAAEEGQQLLGVAAARSAEKFGVRMGYLVDLLFDPGRPEAGRSLLARVERELASQGCAMVTALAAGGASAPLLRRSGFRRLPAFLMPHPVHFCVRDRSGGHPSMLSQQDWYMSWSDHDVV